MNKPNLEIIGSLDRSLSESLQDNQSEPTCEAGWSVLHRLSNAHKAAYACGRDAWDFSIKLSEIQNLGAETYVVRKLICQGLIVHRKETTGAIPSDDKRRTFGETDGLVLSEKSCFVVSKQGYQIVNSYKMNSEAKESDATSSHHSQPLGQHNKTEKVETGILGASSRPHQLNKPVWDRERRELRLGEFVVKRFRWPAVNQELVLNAFEDLGWPPRISNPLATHPNICPKTRLHDTLKCLNRKQVNELIKFRGDGTGLGVLLEIRLD